MGAFKDLTGMKFGRFTVVSRAANDNRGQARWICSCECENRVAVRGTDLRNGRSKSCGCLHRETVTTHGMHKSPEYYAWNGLLQRCGNPKNPNYKYYGGRGPAKGTPSTVGRTTRGIFRRTAGGARSLSKRAASRAIVG